MTHFEHSKIAGIKIETTSISADLMKQLLKFREDSIASIKSDITEGKYFLSCSLVGEMDKIALIIRCYEELTSLGYSVKLFANDLPSDIDYFKNWLETMKDNRKDFDEFDEE